MKEIQLINRKYPGLKALVDDENFERLLPFKWYAKKHRKTFYAQRNLPRIKGTTPRSETMHRTIVGMHSDNEVIDRRDGCGLNNQISNLRKVTFIQSSQNRGIKEDNTTGFKGVSWHKHQRKWCASIRVNKRSTHLGYFHFKENASLAYELAARHYFREFRRIDG